MFPILDALTYFIRFPSDAPNGDKSWSVLEPNSKLLADRNYFGYGRNPYLPHDNRGDDGLSGVPPHLHRVSIPEAIT